MIAKMRKSSLFTSARRKIHLPFTMFSRCEGDAIKMTLQDNRLARTELWYAGLSCPKSNRMKSVGGCWYMLLAAENSLLRWRVGRYGSSAEAVRRWRQPPAVILSGARKLSEGSLGEISRSAPNEDPK